MQTPAATTLPINTFNTFSTITTFQSGTAGSPAGAPTTGIHDPLSLLVLLLTLFQEGTPGAPASSSSSGLSGSDDVAIVTSILGTLIAAVTLYVAIKTYQFMKKPQSVGYGTFLSHPLRSY